MSKGIRQKNEHPGPRPPNVDPELFNAPTTGQLFKAKPSSHPPRILLLYGSLRERSFSRLAVEEAARLLEAMGAETRVFNPRGGCLWPMQKMPLTPKVQELRELAQWSEGMVWCSPERHGAMTGIMKTQIDWIPLSIGGMRPTQGKTLAVMQVCGGSQSFNAVNQLRVLGRWMRMVTIPNQSSVPKAFMEFDDNDRMKPSPLLQSHRRCDGGAGEIYPADPGSQRLPDRPVFGAGGKCRRSLQTRQPAVHVRERQ